MTNKLKARRERTGQRRYRTVHRSTEAFLSKPKSLVPPKRRYSSVPLAPADRSMLQSIGSGSVADGIEILCEAFRGGLRYLADKRRKKPSV